MIQTDSCTFEPFKVIQEMLVLEMLVSILHCKTMYCYSRISPNVFITSKGLIPGGFSTKMGRQAVFFTVVNPTDDKQGLRETFCDLSKARIAPYKKYLETTSGYSILVQFNARSRRRTAILPNKV